MQTSSGVSAFLGTPLRSALGASLILISLPVCVPTQTLAQTAAAAVATETELSTATLVPQQVRYAGKLPTRTAATVEAETRIYEADQGGDPIWSELQRIPVAQDGSYSVLLGSASSGGLPQAVFAGGAARWLSVSVERGPEQERVLLSSVPNAMKSADAQSLAGHAVSEFVAQEQLAALAHSAAVPVQPSAAAPEGDPNAGGTVTGSGTAGTIPFWTGILTPGNSAITQLGSNIGINLAAPSDTLDVGGKATIRGALTVVPTTPATTAAGENSQHLNLTADAWSTQPNPLRRKPLTGLLRLSATTRPTPVAHFTFSFRVELEPAPISSTSTAQASSIGRRARPSQEPLAA